MPDETLVTVISSRTKHFSNKRLQRIRNNRFITDVGMSLIRV